MEYKLFYIHNLVFLVIVICTVPYCIKCFKMNIGVSSPYSHEINSQSHERVVYHYTSFISIPAQDLFFSFVKKCQYFCRWYTGIRFTMVLYKYWHNIYTFGSATWYPTASLSTSLLCIVSMFTDIKPCDFYFMEFVRSHKILCMFVPPPPTNFPY